MKSEEFKLPEGWKWVKLGEEAEFHKGRKYLKYDAVDEGKYEFIHYGELFTTYKEYIKEVHSRIDENKGAFISKENDVLMPTSDVTPTGLATACCIKKNGVVLGSDILVVRVKSKLEGVFLSYLIRFNKRKILQLVKGTTVYHLYASDLKNLKIPLPPLPEQQKIAEILETVDNTIEKTEKIIEKYKRIKQGLMQELLTKGIDKNWQIRSEKTHKFKDSPLGRIPEEWEVVRLGEVGEIITGSTPPTDKKEFYGEEYMFITPEDISEEKYICTTTRKLSKLGFKISRKLPPKSVCIVCIGSTIGKVGLTIEKCTTNQQINTIIPDKNIYNPEALYYFVLFYTQKPLRQESGLQAVPIVNKNRFSKIKIPLPPLPEQQRIAKVLSQIDEVIEKEENYKRKLESLKRALMEDLLTGKVRVNKLLEEGYEDKKGNN